MAENVALPQFGDFDDLNQLADDREISPAFPTDTPLPPDPPLGPSGSGVQGIALNVLPQAQVEARLTGLEDTVNQIFSLLQQVSTERRGAAQSAPIRAEAPSVFVAPAATVAALVPNTPLPPTQMYQPAAPFTPATPPPQPPAVAETTTAVAALQMQLNAMATQLAAVQDKSRHDTPDPFERFS